MKLKGGERIAWPGRGEQAAPHEGMILRAVGSAVLISLIGFAGATGLDPLSFDDAPRTREILHPHWFETSFLDLGQDLEEAVAAGKKGLMVYFGQENCAYCEALMEINFKTPDIVRYTREHFNVVALDIWGSRAVTTIEGATVTEQQFSIAQQTNFTPSIIFYDATGRQAFKMRGYYPPYKFRAALEYIADDHYQAEGFAEYLERADPPPRFSEDDLNEQDFFQPPPYALDRSRFPAVHPLVVFFEQSQCHACDVLHTEPLAQAQAKDLLNLVEAVQLDMWADTPVITPAGRRTTAREWARDLGIFYAPTLLFFDERGAEIIRIDSVVRLYRLSRVLEYVIARGYETGLNYQQWHGRQ